MKKILSFGFLLFFLFTAEGFKLIAEEKSAWEGTESRLPYLSRSFVEGTDMGRLFILQR